MGEDLVKSLQNTKFSVDEKLEQSFISLFSQKPNILSVARKNAKDAHEVEEQSQTVDLSDKVQYQSGQSMEVDVSGEESDSECIDSLESSDEDEAAQKDAMIDCEDGGSIEASDKQATLDGHIKEHVEFHGGRLRRKAVFENDNNNNLKVKQRNSLCLLDGTII